MRELRIRSFKQEGTIVITLIEEHHLQPCEDIGFMPIGLDEPYRIVVGNSPINYIDPSGLLTADWHFQLTYMAARSSGYGRWDSAKMAWNVMTEDRNATDSSASAANIHAMRGQLPSGEYQTVGQANTGTNSVLQNGSLYSALHAGQDLPVHNYESMENFGLNWSTAKHIWGDMFPGNDIVSQAYQNTKNILSSRGCGK